MGENRLMCDLYEENQRLKARIKELESQHFSECAQIAHYSDELKATEEVARRTADYGKATPAQFLGLLDEYAKMKKLLKEAVEDFHWLAKWQDSCELCGARYDDGDCPVNDNVYCDEVYVWEHEAEALALIGEDINVPTTETDINVGSKSGWISCKDRMPEVNEPVLFIFNTEGGFKTVMYGWHQTIKGLGSGWHQAGVGGARADEEVTYWQPLPEPPEV